MFISRLLTRVYKETINPSSTAYHIWLAVVAQAVTFNLVTVIFRVTFLQILDIKHQVQWRILDSIFDVVYLLDIQFKFRTAFYENGLLVDDQPSIAEKYGRSKRFLVDVFSLIPLDIILLNRVSNPACLRFNRLLRIGRMLEFFKRTERWFKRPLVLRISRLLLYVLLIIHWNACCYIQVSAWIGFGEDDWVYYDINDANHPENGTLTRMYIYAFYWSTLTLSTIGELSMPQKNSEFIFTICNFMIGIFIFATIVGHVNDMIRTVTEDEEELRSQLDSVKFYMQSHRVGGKVQNYLVKWFEYIWQTKRPLQLDKKLEHLPTRLQAKLKLSMMEKAIEKSIFRDCDRRFLKELALRLRHDVFSPGEFICKRGEIGHEMYLIVRGKMCVILNGHSVFLTDGQIFGEISLLDIPGNMNANRRTADVKSIGYSDVLILSKGDLHDILEDFPGIRETLEDHAMEELKHNGKFGREMFTEAVDSRSPITNGLDKRVYLERINKIEGMVVNIGQKLDLLIKSVGREKEISIEP